ncbi:MAG: dihydroorotate dehydrogenase electron transfer subunit [Firmicutes bacterium]|nr:dihydroorotate dehydrogenase electron transfer subunit [Bacillota bacterium]
MSLMLQEEIVCNRELVTGIYQLTFRSAYVSQNAKPGQFVNIKCCEGFNAILRRPVSICSVDRENKNVTIVFQKRGTGTSYLAKKRAGDVLDLIGPLGSHFDLSENYKNIAVVGGGIGIFPLLFLLEQKQCVHKTAYIGFRSKNYVVLEEAFKHNSHELIISTDDGSLGQKGFITDLLEKRILEEGIKGEKYDIIYTCGPGPMMKKVVELASKAGIKCQVSLEQRMGCGIGACLACACKIKLRDDWQYKRVCKDGPIFWGEEVDFDD